MDINHSNRPEWAPETVDLEKASAARIHDYMLGGFHNFEIDREYGEKAIAFYPDTVKAAWDVRAFLRRSVQFVQRQDVDQFIDVGSGIPTMGHIHEVTEELNPDARVAYVDIDPVAVAHCQAILGDNPNVTAVQADAGEPAQILENPYIRQLIDFQRPVGLVLISVLHFIPDNERAYNAIYTLRDALPSGSYMIVAHATYHGVSAEIMKKFEALLANSSNPSRYRSKAEIERFFAGWELLEPGLVFTPLWRPLEEDAEAVAHPTRSLSLVGVAYKK